MTLQGALAILSGVSPLLLIVVGWFLKRRLDDATANRTNAEAGVQKAVEDKTSQEAAGLVITHATQLIEQFKDYQAERDKLAAERIAAGEADRASLSWRVSRMEESFSRLRALLAAHGIWDATALVELRQANKDYPEPPPLPQSIEDYHT